MKYLNSKTLSVTMAVLGLAIYLSDRTHRVTYLTPLTVISMAANRRNDDDEYEKTGTENGISSVPHQSSQSIVLKSEESPSVRSQQRFIRTSSMLRPQNISRSLEQQRAAKPSLSVLPGGALNHPGESSEHQTLLAGDAAAAINNESEGEQSSHGRNKANQSPFAKLMKESVKHANSASQPAKKIAYQSYVVTQELPVFDAEADLLVEQASGRTDSTLQPVTQDWPRQESASSLIALWGIEPDDSGTSSAEPEPEKRKTLSSVLPSYSRLPSRVAAVDLDAAALELAEHQVQRLDLWMESEQARAEKAVPRPAPRPVPKVGAAKAAAQAKLVNRPSGSETLVSLKAINQSFRAIDPPKPPVPRRVFAGNNVSGIVDAEPDFDAEYDAPYIEPLNPTPVGTRASELTGRGVPKAMVTTQRIETQGLTSQRAQEYSKALQDNLALQRRCQTLVDRLVQERTAKLELLNHELQIARDRAIEAAKVKSQFVANISHELRTPLSGILGLSELLAEMIDNGDLQGMAKDIHGAAQSLMKVVNDLLDFSQIETGKLELSSAKLSIRQIVQNVLRKIGPSAAQKCISLTTAIDAHIPEPLFGDSERVEQVLLNFVQNAVKFTQSGKVSVAAGVDQREDEWLVVRFAVTDTGVGIAQEDIDKLFMPFTQADNSNTRKYGGAGLGLTISRGLVNAMSGNVRVESVPGRGSTFSFTIPFQLRGNSNVTPLPKTDGHAG